MMYTRATTEAEALAVMKASFKERGQAKLDRLDQDERSAVQRVRTTSRCRRTSRERSRRRSRAIKSPADGK